jgi:hypothetical protein
LLHKLRRLFGRRVKKAVRRREDRAFWLSVGNGSMTLYCTIGFGEEVARSAEGDMLYLNLDDNGAPLSALLCRSNLPRLEVRFIVGV